MQNSQPSGNPLCAGGCGFFGNASFDNYCSKCFKEQKKGEATEKIEDLKKIEQPPKPAEPAVKTPETTQQKPQESPSTATPTEKAPTQVPEEPQKPVQTDSSRCWSCNKKIGLTGIKCKCEYFFCAKHRYAEQHKCSYDYKAAAKTDISVHNPIVAANKIEKL